jgi:hypothetical protein
MESYEAAVALPMPHIMAATARLRGDLRRQILDEGTLVLPDWTTFQVTAPFERFDGDGRVVYEYRAVVECSTWSELLHSPAAAI